MLQVTRSAPAAHGSGAAVTDLTSTAAQTTIRVASTTGFTAGDYIQIDSEIILVGTVTTCGGAPCFNPVTRAALGTTAATHTSPASVANLTAPGTSSLYFTFGANSVSSAQCNGVNGLGCAVKLTQTGLQ